MPAEPALARHATTSRSRAPAPPAAERLRLPLYQRAQQRMRARWGFDLNAADAAERAAAVLAGSPEDVDALLLAAAVRSSRGDGEGALAAAREAASRDPASARARSTLAALLAGAGDTEQALAHARAATELDPEDPAASYNLGLALWGTGERRRARAELDRAAALLGMPRPSWWRPRHP